MANHEDTMLSTSESSSAPATPGEMSHADRIGDLPQELYDEIFHLSTLDFETESIVEICDKYKPPKQLHINKATRCKVAQQYYSSNVFRHKHNSCSKALFYRWLKSLPAEHTVIIGTISWSSSVKETPIGGFSLKFIVDSLTEIAKALAEDNVELHEDCLKADIPHRGERFWKGRLSIEEIVSSGCRATSEEFGMLLRKEIKALKE